MGAHRYWRVKFSGSSGTSTEEYVWIQEVYFRNALEQDVGVGGVPSASSVWNSNYSASLAFDKSLTGNGWRSAVAQFPAWIAYDCVTPVEVRTVELVMHATTSYFPAGKIFVEFSDDTSVWEPVPSFTSGTNSGGSIWVLGLALEGEALSAHFIGKMSQSYGDQMPQSPLRASAPKAGVWVWEVQTTGTGRIAGVVTIENIPGARKVRLYRKQDGLLIRQTWSATNGAYSFENLDPNWEYFVVAHDHLRVHNAVVSDMIDPP